VSAGTGNTEGDVVTTNRIDPLEKSSVTVAWTFVGALALATDAVRASATDATSITPTAHHLLLRMGLLRLSD
jgi:hypothetical protein